MWFNILGKVQANMGIGTIAQIYAKEVISGFKKQENNTCNAQNSLQHTELLQK